MILEAALIKNDAVDNLAITISSYLISWETPGLPYTAPAIALAQAAQDVAIAAEALITPATAAMIAAQVAQASSLSTIAAAMPATVPH